jgi:hypothetical protein
VAVVDSRAEDLLPENKFCGIDPVMTRKQIESAVAGGRPFALRMADGREYLVPHRDYISLPPRASYVIVYDDDGHFTVLPLLTMTGLQSDVTSGP